jgi:glutathione S-transferase
MLVMHAQVRKPIAGQVMSDSHAATPSAAHQPTIVGSYLSPYVRKVLACLHLKGVDCSVDPIVPFYGDEEFARISPLRRVPVLIDGDVTIADSTVICEYLDERYAGAPLLPSGAAARARARWLEEFADSRMGDVFIWRLYNQRVINRFVWQVPPDDAMVARAIGEEIPAILDYLEPQLPVDGYLFGDAMSLADVAIASFFRNLEFARHAVDAQRWPTTMRYVRRALDAPAFALLRPFEEVCMRTPIARHREALMELGAPIAPATLGTARPRRGPMSV